MKKIFLLLSLAVGFAMAQSGTPVTYDDDNRCNNPGATLAPGIYEPSGACQQFGYVCRLSSEASGMVIFWLGADANCTTLHTTQLRYVVWSQIGYFTGYAFCFWNCSIDVSEV